MKSGGSKQPSRIQDEHALKSTQSMAFKLVQYITYITELMQFNCKDKYQFKMWQYSTP